MERGSGAVVEKRPALYHGISYFYCMHTPKGTGDVRGIRSEDGVKDSMTAFHCTYSYRF